MKLRIPRPRNKYPLPEWSAEMLTIGNVTVNEFIGMFQQLPKPTQKRLYIEIKRLTDE